MNRPIVPTRIIPPGAPLPARPPAEGEVPPWHSRPAAPPAPPVAPPPPAPAAPAPEPPPAPVEVRHVHEVLLVPPVPAVPGMWARVRGWLVTWRMGVAVTLAVTPWLNGHSPVGAWSHALHDARTEAGVPAAYIIATAALASAVELDRHTGRAVPRFLLVTAGLGAFGVVSWWDPILLLTGVKR